MKADAGGDELFEQGKKYNQKSSGTYQPAVARQYFELAAAKEHPKATACLALMLYYGEGGAKDFTRAVTMLARAHFALGDSEALDSLADLLNDEVDAGQTTCNDVDLGRLAERVAELHTLSEQVRNQILRLITPPAEE